MSNQHRFGQVGAVIAVVAALLAPAGAATAATVSVDLCATTGSMTMPDGATVPVLGYASGDCTGSPVAQVPGPVIDVAEGDEVSITLYNGLGEATALLIPGAPLVADVAGAAPGGSTSYTFTASHPGTFLYEAGLVPNGEHQAAMGLYGALIVRSATADQAYDDPTTAYDDEAVMVLSEVDPALNAAGAGFDMRNYAPKYFLINGKAYPDTNPVATAAGNDVLIRYVNAGLQYHSMAVLGATQRLIADDGNALSYARSIVAETFGPGQTADVIVAVPAVAPDGAQYAVYDGSFMFHNKTAAGTGGMLTFLTVGVAPPPGGDTTGPTATAPVLAPNPTTGAVPVTVTATIDDTATGGSNVAAAEYYIDATSGTPTAMTASDGTFDSQAEGVTGTISTATLGALPSGTHTIYVRGQDALGNWGGFNLATLNLDKLGPTTSGVTLTPSATNGAVSVALSATASDVATGNSVVTAAEYTIDGGAATPMTVSPMGSPTVSLSATISQATVAALPVGAHTVAVRSQDGRGNWGGDATATLTIDTAGPTTSGVTAAPNPTNGLIGVNSTISAVRVTATIADTLSKVVAGEAFIDTVGSNGTGIVMVASDGVFNALSETGYADIPLTTIRQLSDGNHTLHVHGKDAAGNWGATSSVVLLVDKTAPTLTGVAVQPSPTNGASEVTLTINGASDGSGSGVTGGEYWICPPTCSAPTPGAGTSFAGTAATVPVATLATGTYTVSARIKDGASNWGTVSSATLTVWADAIFSDGFEGGNTNAWSSRSTPSNGRLNVTTAAALVGTYGLQAQGNNTNYVQYNFGTAAIPAAPTYDARFYFRPNGNNSTGKDIFSAATTSSFGTTLFRVRYRLNAGTPQVQIQVGTSNTNSTWTTINGGTSSNVIEVVWQAVGWGPSPGTLQLVVNGTPAQTLTTTSTASVGSVRLGSVTSTGNNTALYFDAFVSKRRTTPLVGP